MSADALVRQSESAIEHVKQTFAVSVIHQVICENCSERSYSISSFSDTNHPIIARLKCLNCGAICDFTIYPTTYGACTGIKSPNIH